MADSYTLNLNLRKPEIGAAHDTWGAGLNGDMNLIDAVFEADGDGTSVGLNVGTDKVLRATGGTVLLTADRLVLVDATDATKHARIGLTNIPTGTTHDYYLPATAGDLVTRTATQNFTNKTTTDPAAGSATQAIISAKYVKDAIAAAVASFEPPPTFATGDIIACAAATREGWAKLAGGTIGNSGSGATVIAGPTAELLFKLFWSINAGTWTINGGRGSNANADWTNLKTITLPDAQGHALIGIGGAVNLVKQFDKGGAKEHVLTVAQMPAHSHHMTESPITKEETDTDIGYPADGSSTDVFYKLLDTDPIGGGLAHPNVQPSMGVVYWIKL